MEGALKKLRIESFTDPDYSGNPKQPPFEVLFNPNTYSVKYAVEYEEEQGKGTTGVPQKFKQAKPSEFGVEFTLDGTGASADVVDVDQKIDEFLSVVKEYDGEIHRPPYLKVIWGTLLFNCVFKGANVKYTLFKPDGAPLRAVVSATFLGFIDDTKRVADERASSPDLTRVHAVTAGETLPLLCHRYYGDARHYVSVAQHNDLNDFRRLEAGGRLLFPPLERANGSGGR